SAPSIVRWRRTSKRCGSSVDQRSRRLMSSCCASVRPLQRGRAVDRMERRFPSPTSCSPGRESGWLPALPPNINAFLITERISQHLHEMLGRSAVGYNIDGLGCEVVIVVVERFFFQCIDQYLQVRLSNRTNQLISPFVI